jgi:hypothetical protein
MRKVSFDFDGTLDKKNVQLFATKLVEDGFDVWIVTSRTNTQDALKRGWTWIKKQNEELYRVADECGITNIKFTDHVDKIEFLKDKDFIFHLDDDEYELMAIFESGDKCKAININYFDWENACLQLLK